jgi:hypothetical protein
MKRAQSAMPSGEDVGELMLGRDLDERHMLFLDHLVGEKLAEARSRPPKI